MNDPLILVVDYGNGGPEMTTGNELDVAEMLRQEQYGADFELHGIYALDADAKPVRVEMVVDGKYDYDEDSWANPLVTITMPDGSKLKATYTIDGRA